MSYNYIHCKSNHAIGLYSRTIAVDSALGGQQGRHPISRATPYASTKNYVQHGIHRRTINPSHHAVDKKRAFNCRSRFRTLDDASEIQPLWSVLGTIRLSTLSSVVLCVFVSTYVRFALVDRGIPFSKSPHLFIVILLLSNSPSYSIPAFFVFSPAVFLVSPQLKSSNFQ